MCAKVGSSKYNLVQVHFLKSQVIIADNRLMALKYRMTKYLIKITN